MKRFLLACLFAPLLVSAQGDGQYRNNKRDNYRGGRGNGAANSYNMQGESGSAFTIFATSGDRFYLMINGIKQNTYPQSRIRIEYLPQVVNDIQIIFDDNETPAISKRITFMDPLEGRPINLVLRLERMRDGRPHLEFVKMNTLEKDYRREEGEYVMRYGKDDGRGMVNPDDHGNGGYMQTSGNQGGYQGGNQGGYNGTGSGPRQSLPPVTPPPPPPPPAPTAMDPTSFADAKKTISGASFDDTKMTTAKVIAQNNFFTVDQIMQLCRLFSFEDNKLEFAKFAYNRCIEQRNYYKVGTIFNFSSNKEELNKFITEHTQH